MELRDELHTLIRVQFCARRLRDGGGERFPEEADAIWASMAACEGLVRQTSAAYSIVALGGEAERQGFLAASWRERARMIEEAMNGEILV